MTNKKIEFWIMTSSEDIASQTIKNHLLNSYPFSLDSDEMKEWDGNPTYIFNFSHENSINYPPEFSSLFTIRIVQTNEKLIMLDQNLDKSQLDSKFTGDFIIFASRHKSKSMIPSILTHAPGNWNSDNKLGGKPNSLSFTSALMLKYAYNNLMKQNELKNLEWAVDLEVDHHGPTELHNPIIFMELGSSESNWSNKMGAAAVGDAIIETIYDFSKILFTKLHIQSFLKGKNPKKRDFLYKFIGESLKSENLTFAIGFGGPHYARNFSKIYNNNKTSDIFISHIIPKYSVMNLTDDHIRMMINRTLEPINTAILDWKGLNSAEKKHINSLISKHKIEIKKTKDFKI